MLWLELFSPPCTDTKVLEKKIVALDMNKKETENEVNDMKINESKQIRMKTNWMKTEIKVDLTKSFSNCACGD